MNVDGHLRRLTSCGFTFLLGLLAPLSGKRAQIFKYAPLSQHAGTTSSLPSVDPQSTAIPETNQKPHAVASDLAPVHFITFRNKYGQTGVLDWKGDRVMYSGDLPIDQGADAFFKSLYVGKTCSDGTAVRGGPKDREGAPGAPPLHRLNFQSVLGQVATVELTKKDVEYSGDLPLDKRAREFFRELWVHYHACFREK